MTVFSVNALMVVAVSSPEMSVNFCKTKHYSIPEHSNLHLLTSSTLQIYTGQLRVIQMGKKLAPALETSYCYTPCFIINYVIINAHASAYYKLSSDAYNFVDLITYGIIHSRMQSIKLRVHLPIHKSLLLD
jgi:hypothetical protein